MANLVPSLAEQMRRTNTDEVEISTPRRGLHRDGPPPCPVLSPHPVLPVSESYFIGDKKTGPFDDSESELGSVSGTRRTSRQGSPGATLPASLESPERAGSGPPPPPRPAQLPPLPEKRGQEESISNILRDMFMYVTVFALVAITLIPFWDIIRILRNPGFTWMIGFDLPVAFLVILSVVALGSIFFVCFLRYKVQPPAFSPLMLIVILSSVAVVFGLVYLLFGHGLAEKSRAAALQLQYNCEFGGEVGPLYRQAAALFQLRSLPACMNKNSVEQCSGYIETPVANTLQFLESHYVCSNFCNIHVRSTVPALFSKTPVAGRPTCHRMLARNLKSVVTEIGVRTHAIGCILIFAAVLNTGTMLISLCSKRRKAKATTGKAVPREGYGSVA